MLVQLRPALVSMALFTLLLGFAYPLAVTGVAEGLMRRQAEGSLLSAGGRVVGSELIGQAFTRPEYLHPRRSAAGPSGYDAAASSGSNLGPLNDSLIKRVAADAATIRAEAPGAAIPADAVTTSGSGLDPHISPAYAALQVGRIARARGIAPDAVQRAIAGATEQRTLGILGQPRVNVLKANLALDALAARAQP